MSAGWPKARLVATVLVGQMLYTAGDSVSGGKFLTYFVSELTDSVLDLSLLFILPETVAVAGLLVQPILRRMGRPSRVWLAFAVLARLFGLAICLTPSLPTPMRIAVVFVLVALFEVSQAISYAALIAWLAALVPDTAWGRLFAKRGMAIAATLAIVPPIVGAVVLSAFGRSPTPGQYVLILGGGQLVTAAGVAVYATLLRRRPAQNFHQNTERPHELEQSSNGKQSPPPRPLRRLLKSLASDRTARRTLLTGWHLAAANGLTQSAFFFYSKDHLGIDVGTAAMLTGLMFALQIPAAAIAGALLDRRSNRRVYIGSLLLVATALPLWMLAAWDIRAIVVAYAVWGVFGAVNLAGRTLVMRLLDPRDIAGGVAAFRFVGGAIAGLSGLAGGAILNATRTEAGTTATACLGLIAVSFVGRLTAPLWLLGQADPREHPSRPSRPA